MLLKVSTISLVVVALVVAMPIGASGKQKKWLVVEDPPRSMERDIFDEYAEFPRLLIMQISKAGVFRCCDRTTYRIQSKETALGDGGDIDFQSVGHAVSWIIRSHNTTRGKVLTVSLGYNNIGKGGNNELITSEDVVVRERNVKGKDFVTEVARKSARAILFRLSPPQVLEVEGKERNALIDFGKDFFAVGEKVEFTRKIERKGREISRKVGVGVITSVNADSSMARILNGMVNENDYVEIVDVEKQMVEDGRCPECQGKRKYKVEVKCDACDGQGKIRKVSYGFNREVFNRLVQCRLCNGKGVRMVDKPCSECNGTGKASNDANL